MDNIGSLHASATSSNSGKRNDTSLLTDEEVALILDNLSSANVKRTPPSLSSLRENSNGASSSEPLIKHEIPNKRKVTDPMMESCKYARGNVQYWEKKKQEASTELNREALFKNAVDHYEKIKKYLSTLNYGNTKYFFYCTLETLALQGTIEITKRDGKLYHPTEFKILNPSGCIGKFDCLFVKKEEEEDNNKAKGKREPSAVTSGTKSYSAVLKSAANKRWKNELCWFITKQEHIPTIIEKTDCDTIFPGAVDKEAFQEIAHLLRVPFPFCFATDEAKEVVFKLIVLPNKGNGIKVKDGINTDIFYEQLRIMDLYSNQIFASGSTTSTVSASSDVLDEGGASSSFSSPPLERLYEGVMHYASGGRRSL